MNRQPLTHWLYARRWSQIAILGLALVMGAVLCPTTTSARGLVELTTQFKSIKGCAIASEGDYAGSEICYAMTGTYVVYLVDQTNIRPGSSHKAWFVAEDSPVDVTVDGVGIAQTPRWGGRYGSRSSAICSRGLSPLC